MKLVDAEKLIAEIKRRQEQSRKMIGGQSRVQLCRQLLDFIDSLQQEQPKVDLVTELKHHLATTSKDQLEKEWKELEPWNNVGPTVQEFLYGKQPEVDLDKEMIIDYVHNHYHYDKDFDGYGHSNLRPVFTRKDLTELARYFYELGLNARKEK